LAAAPISRWAGIVLLLVVATIFGANHVAARIAFEHGTNVTTAVAFRSAGTAVFLLLLLLLYRIPLTVQRQTAKHALLVGLLVASQSYCLYSAVAIIPVALALLVFQTFPMMLALLSWAAGGERPARVVLAVMPVALVGIALALDVWGRSGNLAERWREIGAGVLWALGAAVSFAAALLLMTRWLAAMDGRLRSFLTMCVVAAVVLAGGAAAGDFRLPADATGWLAVALLTACYGTAITSTFILLPRLGAVNNAVVLNFEPIAVLAIAWVVLDQKVSALQILGAFIVTGAIMILGTRR